MKLDNEDSEFDVSTQKKHQKVKITKRERKISFMYPLIIRRHKNMKENKKKTFEIKVFLKIDLKHIYSKQITPI